MKTLIREATLWIALTLLSILVGGTVYQMMVIVPEFARDIPNGMTGFARSHISTKAFWTSPIQDLAMLFLLASMVLNWKNSRRYWLLGSAFLAILATVLTIVYALPQLQIMGILDGNPSADTELLTKTVNSWIFLDNLRFWAVIIPSYLCFMKAFSIKPD